VEQPGRIAPDFQKLVTHTFVGDDAYMTSDAVFGVKETLVAPYMRLQNAATTWHSTFDFVLTPSSQGRELEI
jgi:hydroxyquinol 1,2-dioxygenase